MRMGTLQISKPTVQNDPPFERLVAWQSGSAHLECLCIVIGPDWNDRCLQVSMTLWNGTGRLMYRMSVAERRRLQFQLACTARCF